MSLTPAASIDLHGCRREQALYKVTRFLESSVQNNNNVGGEKVWVCIITGSGSHSQDGPVLREAVRSLLTRREMEYMIQRGKGAFLVNATSGHELGSSSSSPAVVHAVDSKVIVTTDDTFCDKRVRRNVVPSSSRALSSTSSTTTLGYSSAIQPLTPAEVAADDDLMERIKTTSAQEHTQCIRDEQRELNKAISISKQEVDRLQQEEEKQLKEILHKSQYEQSLGHEEEEKRLAEALARSQEQDKIQKRKNEQHKRKKEERLAAVLWKPSQDEENAVRENELLERAISISQLHVIASQHNDDDDDDDKALREALAQSMHDVNAVDSQLNQVLEISLRDETMSEDELIQQALLLSLNETYDTTVANVD